MWCWRRPFRVPWAARRSNQSILKENSPEYSLKFHLQHQVKWTGSIPAFLHGMRSWRMREPWGHECLKHAEFRGPWPHWISFLRAGRHSFFLLFEEHMLRRSVQFSSVTHSCPTLCNPMDFSTPGFPVHHQLPEPTKTHVHRVSDALQQAQECDILTNTQINK